MTENPTKLVQIIPTSGWHMSFKVDGISRVPPRGATGRLVAFGLRQDGKVVPLTVDGDGDIVDATTLPNFGSLHYGD